MNPRKGVHLFPQEYWFIFQGVLTGAALDYILNIVNN